MSEHEGSYMEKIAAFHAGGRIMENISAQNFFNREFPDLDHAFCPELNCVVCMDEGTTHKDMEEGDKLAMAGSGILFPAANEEERLEKVSDLMIKLGVTTITSHGGCGAAGIAYRRDFPDSKPSVQDIENYAKQWSQKLVDKINEKQHEAEHVFIATSEMERPAEFHNARVVYFDSVGGFNPSKEKGLPMGFVVERKFLPADYAAAELKVACNIAFGDHGLGNNFTKDSPFIIVVFANSLEESNQIQMEAKEALKDNLNFQAGKIRIDGVVVGEKLPEELPLAA